MLYAVAEKRLVANFFKYLEISSVYRLDLSWVIVGEVT